jgi:hypothetical protein
MVEKVPLVAIAEVATCSVEPSYISDSVGLSVANVAPLNFRPTNLNEVKLGMGVKLPGPENELWLSPALTIVKEGTSGVDAEPLVFVVGLAMVSEVVPVPEFSVIVAFTVCPAAMPTPAWASSEGEKLLYNATVAVTAVGLPPLAGRHWPPRDNAAKLPDVSWISAWAKKPLPLPVVGQVRVGRLIPPLNVVIAEEAVAL